MPKKVCPNGHIYDSSIYGDECPLCPKGGNNMNFNPQPNLDMPTGVPHGGATYQPEQGTHIASPNAQAFGNVGNVNLACSLIETEQAHITIEALRNIACNIATATKNLF